MRIWIVSTALVISFMSLKPAATLATKLQEGFADVASTIENLSEKGDDSEGELLELRKRLNVTPSTPIKKISSKSLPASMPLKLYLASVEDEKVRNLLVEWVNKWNRTNGEKYGIINITSDTSQADILLVRFTQPISLRTPSQSKSKDSDQIVNAFVYLVAQKRSELEVWWRWGEIITLGEYRIASHNIEVELEKGIKERAKENKR